MANVRNCKVDVSVTAEFDVLKHRNSSVPVTIWKPREILSYLQIYGDN